MISLMKNELPLLDSLTSPSELRDLSDAELDQLAEEVRHRIKDGVSQNGGHLASNLGVVELTIALHRHFDFSHDRLLWDVGHQAYPHKLLTGRAQSFLRTGLPAVSQGFRPERKHLRCCQGRTQFYRN